MAIPHYTKHYAVDDAKMKKITADPAGGTTTFGSLIDLPGIKKVDIGFDIQSKSLRGDNTEMDSNSALVGMTAKIELAKIDLDALAVWIGGTVTDSGGGATDVATYRNSITDTLSYFQFEAKTPTGGADVVGGDAHLLLYKCIISDFSDYGFAEEDYETFGVEFRCVPRLSDGRRWDEILNETAGTIS